MTERILVVGDSHGNMPYMRLALDVADHLAIRIVVSVGDFGFWPTGQRFVAECRRRAKSLGIVLLVLDGNHDAPGEGRRHDGGYLAWTAPTDADGQLDPAILDEPELWHLERGSRLHLADRMIAFVGSAISIDRHRRTIGRSWWPTEALTQAETDEIVAGGSADLLISHDSAWEPPGTPHIRFADDITADLAVQRQRMQSIVAALDPVLHVHGHWHRRVLSNTPYGPVLGLDCESTLGLHVVDLARLDEATGLDPHIAAIWWLDSLDDDARTEILDELESAPERQPVLRRLESEMLAVLRS